jgi:hypothetical protein
MSYESENESIGGGSESPNKLEELEQGIVCETEGKRRKKRVPKLNVDDSSGS